MSSTTITIPAGCVLFLLTLLRMLTYLSNSSYQYVGAALLSTSWVLIYQFMLVSRMRKRAGVQYPQR
jgi:hypothetical protein